MRFAGKCAVVTGAASGISLAVARRLAAESALLVLGDRNEDGVREAALCDPEDIAAAFAVDGDRTAG